MTLEITNDVWFNEEISSFLKLVNSKRSRRGDWNSSILEHAQLHLTVPEILDKASWNSNTSTLSIVIDYNGYDVQELFPDLQELFVFFPGM